MERIVVVWRPIGCKEDAVRILAVLFMVLPLGIQGCAGGGCTEVGGFDGVGALIPRVLFVPSGSVGFEVCDAGDCASATQRLGSVPEGPVGRGASVTFDELGQRFEPGKVNVTVKLFDAKGTAVAAAQRDIELTRSYPNGKSCDGEGYVGGVLKMTAADQL